MKKLAVFLLTGLTCASMLFGCGSKNDTVETVHVKNTGRCRELLVPGAAVRLEVSDNPKRKTKYDLVMVRKQGLG